MIEIRLQGIGEASTRVKIAFIISLIASCAMGATIYQTYFSFTRERAFENTLKFRAIDIRNFPAFLDSLNNQSIGQNVQENSIDIYSKKFRNIIKEKYFKNKIDLFEENKLSDDCNPEDKPSDHSFPKKPNNSENKPSLIAKLCNIKNELDTYPKKDELPESLEFKRHIEDLRLKKKMLIESYLNIINEILEKKDFYLFEKQILDSEPIEKISDSDKKDLYRLFSEKYKTISEEPLDIQDVIKNKIFYYKFYKSGGNHVNKLLLDVMFPDQFEWDTSFSEKYWPYSLHEQTKRIISEEWARNQNINISLLGVHVNVDQFTLFGSVTLMCISFWMFLSVRRENRAIVTLLRDVYDEVGQPKGGKNSKEYFTKEQLKKLKDDEWDIANLAYQGIVHNLVFIKTGQQDRPMSHKDIFGPERSGLKGFIGILVWVLTSLIRLIVYLLFFTPLAAIVFILWADSYTTTNILYPYFINPAEALIERNLEFPSLITGEINWGKAFGVLTSLSCFACIIFQYKTENALRKFYKRLKTFDLIENNKNCTGDDTTGNKNSEDLKKGV